MHGHDSLKVLWITDRFDRSDDDANTVTGPLRRALMGAYEDEIDLYLAYETEACERSGITVEGTTYLPLDLPLSRTGLTEDEWTSIKDALLGIIERVRPDIIQCFGSEWPYGRIASYTPVPVVIHMMGFLNVYHEMLGMTGGLEGPKPTVPRRMLRAARRRAGRLRHLLTRGTTQTQSPVERANEHERLTMQANRYFMGRTDWDRAIVRHYACQAVYFHVPEVMKQPFYELAGTWRYRGRERLRLLTVSSADNRKGNEIILRCAQVLKEVLGLDFTWRVVGRREFFPIAERRAGIARNTVNVELAGMLGPNQVARELTESDLFIHPSLIDNSPNALCEAQLVGCPVIASFVGGVAQLVEHGVTGFLYPYSEPHTLAFLIADICHDADLLERISAQATREALARHDPVAVAHTVRDVYRAIIEVEGAARE